MGLTMAYEEFHPLVYIGNADAGDYFTSTLPAALDGKIQRVSLDEGHLTSRPLEPPSPSVAMATTILNEQAAHDRTYRAGMLCMVRVRMSSDTEDWFRGITTTPRYELTRSGRTVMTIGAYHLTQLLAQVVDVAPIDATNIGAALGEIFDAANWPDTAEHREITLSDWTASLSVWWVNQQPATKSIQSLMNSVGPPARVIPKRNGGVQLLERLQTTVDLTVPARAIHQRPRYIEDEKSLINVVRVKHSAISSDDLAGIKELYEYTGVHLGVNSGSTGQITVPRSALSQDDAESYFARITDGANVAVDSLNVSATSVIVVFRSTNSFDGTVREFKIYGRFEVDIAMLARDNRLISEYVDDDSPTHELRPFEHTVLFGISQATVDDIGARFLNHYKRGLRQVEFEINPNLHRATARRLTLGQSMAIPIADFNTTYTGYVERLRWLWEHNHALVNVVAAVTQHILAAPSGLALTESAGDVTAVWDAVSNATGYVLEWREEGSGAAWQTANVSAPPHTFTP